MRPKEAKEPGALGESGKQWTIVARQPAVKRTVAHAFERMQAPQRYDFARPQGGVRMFGDGVHLRFDPPEESDDQIHSGHGLLCAQQGFTLLTSLDKIHDYGNAANEYYYP